MKNAKIKVLTGATAACILATGFAGPALADNDNSTSNNSVSVSVKVVDDWGSGRNVDIKVTNTGATALSSWEVSMPWTGSINGLWDAAYSLDDERLTVKNLSWNGTLAPGATTTIGLGASGVYTAPANCTFTTGTCLIPGATTTPVAPTTPTEPTTDAPTTGTDEFIVKFANGTPTAAETAAVQAEGMQVRHKYSRVFNGMVVSGTNNQVERLKKRASVVSVEEDLVAYATGADTSATWGLDRLDQRALPLNASYIDNGNGAGVTSYVFDTGIRATHADLAGRVAPGYTAILDGRGTDDANGHGTHVAGTIGGSKYGVAEATTLVPVRVLDSTGAGAYSGIIAGIDWAIAHHVSGPAVANLSLGGTKSAALNNAIEAMVADGITVVVASGNNAADACSFSPASAPSAITVAATDRTDARASYSNVGSCVDVFAPGTSITSTWHTSDTATSTMSGTSMASPHGAGVAAALLSQESSLSPAQVANRILGDATTGKVTNAGTGTPNRLLYRAPILLSPYAPTSVTATAGVGSATVRWKVPFNGGSVLTSQVVTAYLNGVPVKTVNATGTATGIVVTGLTKASSYQFTVKAVSAVGASPESAKSALTLIK